ncbi:hypothetical protein EV641_103232 [Rhodococcus sp. SMB37]|uniref:hypothetical protein n=1 Tax=Rhodococcus sp. SMB37 TaxID=2512213 RepID=UPI0010E875FC|nr:hypothetical protein [Rhodococcus sp. SMB37]TCN55885.1 hypothetical protein EV641_103232 [Rhodococcus sp. SMB37]
MNTPAHTLALLAAGLAGTVALQGALRSRRLDPRRRSFRLGERTLRPCYPAERDA